MHSEGIFFVVFSIIAMVNERAMLVWLGGYFLLFIFGVIGTALFIRRRRHDHAPLNFKLLRGPGETLRKRVAKYDESLFFRLGSAALLPVCVGLAGTGLVLKLRPQTMSQVYAGLGATALASLIALYFAGRWALRDLFRYSSDNLGYLGEREVSEHLVSLYVRGYRIFHDMPAEGARARFNLDHVTVGPSGVAVIETKTRRKGRARPGFKEHVVTFDGNQLIWPWGEERQPLDQAKSEAKWLEEWILKRTGIVTPVKPILALPGWWVERRAVGQVIVVNSKSVAAAVVGKRVVILTPEQIDLIARQLDVACRDVED